MKKYIVEIEVDLEVMQEDKPKYMSTEEILKQELGWLHDSGITVSRVLDGDTKEVI